MSEQDIKRIKQMLELIVKQNMVEKARQFSDDEKVVFQLTGENKLKEIAKKTGFSAGKISKIWQKLEEDGMIIKEGSKYQKFF